MSDTAATTDTATTEPENGEEQGRTFTQDEVNALVRERAERLYKQRVGDVDIKALRARDAEAKTLEERLAEVEKRAKDAETHALRSDIAARFGVSAEDRDLFLTGTDEDTLTAQAKRLTEREADRKKQGNVAPKEGGNSNPGKGGDLREYTRGIFAAARAD